MRIKRSAIIIYSSARDKKGMRESKVIEYKNERYLEIMRELVKEYDEIVMVDKDESNIFKAGDEREEEKRILSCIYNTIKNARNNKVLVISSDMPLIKKDLIEFMGRYEFEEDSLIPYVNGELQKLCAIYDKNILDELKEIIESEEVSFKNLFNKISIRYIFPKDESMFISINKIEEYITYYL